MSSGTGENPGVMIEFSGHPDSYRHWKLTIEGPVATLAMDVQEDGGLVPGYALKLNSYDLGVDIERIDPKHADRQVVASHFSTVEREALENLAEPQWLNAFFTCWCRKEAFIKAVGRGLSLPLDRFAVTVGSDRPGELIALDPSFGFHLSDWSLHDLPPLTGYATALAVHGPAPLISHFQGRI